MTTSVRRLRPLLKCKKQNIPLLLILAQIIHDKMVANQTLFSAPTVTMVVLAQQIADLSSAQQQLKNKTITAAQRNVKRDALWTSLGALLQYVQGLCDAAEEQAAAIITAAGMKIAAVATGSKPVLAAKLGVASGSVILQANAKLLAAGRGKKGRFFQWQYTLDGKTFVSAPSSSVAHTTITGLPPLATVGFRVSYVDSTGAGEWSVDGHADPRKLDAISSGVGEIASPALAISASFVAGGGRRSSSRRAFPQGTPRPRHSSTALYGTRRPTTIACDGSGVETRGLANATPGQWPRDPRQRSTGP